jgi:hypothetical protein
MKARRIFTTEGVAYHRFFTDVRHDLGGLFEDRP